MSKQHSRLNYFAYQEIKGQVNKAMEETGNVIGGKIVGKFFSAYSNLCFTINDGDWDGFFDDIELSKKLRKQIKKKIPKLQKYIDFFGTAEDIYKIKKDADKPIDALLKADKILEDIVDLQKALME